MAQDDKSNLPDDDFNHQKCTLGEMKDYFAELNAKRRVGYSSEHGGFYILSGHQEVRQSLFDWQSFSSAQGVRLPKRAGPPIVALEMDPKEHTEWRRMFQRAVTPKRLALLTGDIEQICDDMIDRFAATGECDLVKDYALQVPVRGIMHAVGLNELDSEKVVRTAMAASPGASDPETTQRALADFADMTLRAAEARRVAPRDDYLTEIINTQVDGKPIPDEALCTLMFGFFTAGHETTATAMGCTLFYVLKDPDLRARIADEPKLLTVAMEEALRLHAPFMNFFRTTTCPVHVHGTTIPEGEKVLVAYDGANRDPAMYPDPDTYKLDRPRRDHVAFGYGIHVCAGQQFARMEIEIAVKRLLARLPDIEILVDKLEQKMHGDTLVVNCPLPARFTPGAVTSRSAHA